MARKRKSNIYFTQDTEDAIIAYISEQDHIIRNKLFNDEIYKAFLKLTEIMINKGSFPYALNTVLPGGERRYQVEALQQEVIIHLLAKISKYKQEKGKAYSYFTIVTLNFLINFNKKCYKEIKRQESDGLNIYSKEVIGLEYDIYQEKEKLDFINQFIEYLNANLIYLFPKEKDYIISSAFLEILKRRDVLPDFEKKKVYLLIREQTNCLQPEITSVFNKIKRIGRMAYSDFFNIGRLNNNKIYK